MSYPYNPKIAPAIGNGLGGFPQKAAAVSSSTSTTDSTTDKKFRYKLSSYVFNGGQSLYPYSRAFITNSCVYQKFTSANWYKITFTDTEVTDVSYVNSIAYEDMAPTLKFSDGVYLSVKYTGGNYQFRKIYIDDANFTYSNIFAISGTTSGTTTNTSQSFTLTQTPLISNGYKGNPDSGCINLNKWFDGKYVIFHPATVGGVASKCVAIIINSTFTAIEGYYRIPDGSAFGDYISNNYFKNIKLVIDYGTAFALLAYEEQNYGNIIAFNFTNSFTTSNFFVAVRNDYTSGIALFEYNFYPIGDGSKNYYLAAHVWNASNDTHYMRSYVLPHNNGLLSGSLDTTRLKIEAATGTAGGAPSTSIWKFLGDTQGIAMDAGKSFVQTGTSLTLTDGNSIYGGTSKLSTMKFGSELLQHLDGTVSYRDLSVEAPDSVWNQIQKGSTSNDYSSITTMLGFNNNGIGVIVLYDDYNTDRNFKFVLVYKN